MQKRYQAVKAVLGDPRWKTCVLSVLAFGLVAHAYGYFAIYLREIRWRASTARTICFKSVWDVFCSRFMCGFVGWWVCHGYVG